MADRKVRVFVGTRKGLYVVESDARRKRWKVSAPIEQGKDVFHAAADPRHPGVVYGAFNDSFFGPMVQRSLNWGKSWKEIGTPLTPATKDRANPFGGPERPKYVIANLWRLEPGHESEPETVFLGVDPHLLFRSDDEGASWAPVPGLNEHPTKKDWNPGNGGPCIHTVLVDPKDRRRMYVGISSAGTFRSDDAGGHWRPTNKGVEAPYLPNKFPEVGQCAHHIVLDPVDPLTSYRQDHGGMYVSHDGMDSWERIGRIGKPFKDDFGFGVTAAAALPGHAFFVPQGDMGRTTYGGGLQVFEWNDKKRTWRALMSPKKFPGEFGVLRQALAADSLDPAGIYVGTTTGDLILSPDAGRSWTQVPYQFPTIRSVSVAP